MQSAYHLIQFGTSERRTRFIWFNSGLQSAERDSFGSVRYFRAQSAIHLDQFGNSECKSFDSVWDFRAQNAIRLVQFGTSERRARFIRFSSVLQSAERDSFGSVRDFITQIAIHLVQFGTSGYK